MKCSNLIRCQGNYNVFMIIISNDFFHFLMALTSNQSLINPINLRNLCLVMSILFVLPRQHNLMQKKLVVCLSCPMENVLIL